MGAKGGYKRVIRYECTTCGSDRYTKKQDAVECCDDAIYAKEQAVKAAALKRSMRKVQTPKVRFVRERGDLKAVASGRCPVRTCEYGKYEVSVPLQNFYRTRKLTKEQAKSKAAGLVRAQIARHLKSWGRHSG